MQIKGNMTIAILAAMIGVPAAMLNHYSAHADTTNNQGNQQMTNQSSHNADAQLVNNDQGQQNSAQDRIVNNTDNANDNNPGHLQSSATPNLTQTQNHPQSSSQPTQPAANGNDHNDQSTDQPSDNDINANADQLLKQIVKSGNRSAKPATVQHRQRKQKRSVKPASVKRQVANLAKGAGTSAVQTAPSSRQITQPTTSVNDAINQVYRSELSREGESQQTPAANYGQSTQQPVTSASQTTTPNYNNPQPAASIAPATMKQRRVIKRHRHHAKAVPKRHKAAITPMPKQQTHRSAGTGNSDVPKVMASLAVIIAAIGLGYVTYTAWDKHYWRKRLQRASSEAVVRNRQFQMDNDNMDLVSSFDRAFMIYANRLQNTKPKKPFRVKRNSSVADTFDQALDAYANNL